jgi:hypothetical protein
LETERLKKLTVEVSTAFRLSGSGQFLEKDIKQKKTKV